MAADRDAHVKERTCCVQRLQQHDHHLPELPLPALLPSAGNKLRHAGDIWLRPHEHTSSEAGHQEQPARAHIKRGRGQSS